MINVIRQLHPRIFFQVLVFEDAVNGVEAAMKAHMRVVWVPMPELKDKIKVKPTVTLQSLEEFKPEMLGLPPYDS